MKTEFIVSDLRARIVQGEFPPGTQLPLRQELLNNYDVSSVILQKAIKQLIAEGFLETRGAKGTLVPQYPVHLYRIAILTGESPIDPLHWDTFSQAFDLAIRELQKNVNNHYTFQYYYNINDDAPEETFNQLQEDIKLHKISGVISLQALKSAFCRSVLEQIPTVFFGKEEYRSQNLISIDFDYIDQITLSLKLLKQYGCKNIAVFVNTEFLYCNIPWIRNAFAEQGLTFRPSWVQASSLNKTAIPWVAQTMRLLFDPEHPVRPDGLIVLNENFLYELISTLDEMNLAIGTKLHIVSHGNRPCYSNYFPRLNRVWVNSAILLNEALRLLEDCRIMGGKRNRLPLHLPNILEVEYAPIMGTATPPPLEKTVNM